MGIETVSRETGIAFDCKSLHNVGVGEDGIEKILEFDMASPGERTLLEYVWKSTAEPQGLTANDATKLRRDRLTDEEPALAGLGLGFPAAAISSTCSYHLK